MIHLNYLNIITNRGTSACVYGMISHRETYRKDFPQIQTGGEDESHIYSRRPPAEKLSYECYTLPSSTIYFIVFVIGTWCGFYYCVNSILLKEAVTWKHIHMRCMLFKEVFFGVCTVRN